MASSQEERFWVKVDKKSHDECWPWKAGTLGSGPGKISYGGFVFNGKHTYAHRVSWQIFNCQPIPKKMVIMHKCDFGLCCNPAHLELGTQKQNVHDRYTRGRAFHHRGTAVVTAKLDDSRVRKIRMFLALGMTQMDIAGCFDISRDTVQRIAARDTWKHVVLEPIS